MKKESMIFEKCPRQTMDNIECFISENGMGVEGEERFSGEEGMIHDDYRIDFIKEHLKWVHQSHSGRKRM